MSNQPTESGPPDDPQPTARRERPYAGKSRLQRRAERRQQLIDAGLELFGTSGFRESTIERVCSDASVGIRAFYEEFGSRESLFRAVYDEVIEHAYVVVQRALAESVGRPPEEVLTSFIQAYMESMLTDPRCGRVVSIESGALDNAMDAHRNSTLRRFALAISNALPAETHREIGNVRMWSLAMGGAVNEVVIDCLVRPRDLDIEVCARDLADIWKRTLHA